LEPDSNVTIERVAHLLKQKSESVTTDEGIQTDRRDEQSENAELPKLESLQPDSNAKSERFVQYMKQIGEIALTDEGRQID
jgi:hypothetical protein